MRSVIEIEAIRLNRLYWLLFFFRVVICMRLYVYPAAA